MFFYVLNKGELPEDLEEMISSDQNITQEDLSNKQDITQEKISTDVEEGMYQVVKIIDGDTFDIASGERVRLIGIDTPERGKIYYKEATDQLESLIGGKMVRLEKDQSEVDRYDRLLRHVYIDDVWVNQKMIEDGYARFVTFPPDVAHVDAFTIAEQNARNAKRGLWATDVLK